MKSQGQCRTSGVRVPFFDDILPILRKFLKFSGYFFTGKSQITEKKRESFNIFTKINLNRNLLRFHEKNPLQIFPGYFLTGKSHLVTTTKFPPVKKISPCRPKVEDTKEQPPKPTSSSLQITLKKSGNGTLYNAKIPREGPPAPF